MHYAPPQLHIPDGFLSIFVSLICWGVTALILAVAISRTNKSLGERQVPLMGIMAAFIFAAQMINFPVAGGTSGHLLGAALAAIVLGPWAAMDRTIHEPSRLVIVAVLYSVESADFLYLLRETEMTKGTLSSHLAKLEQSGYVEIEKTYRGKVPLTLCRLTKQGRSAFRSYRRA